MNIYKLYIILFYVISLKFCYCSSGKTEEAIPKEMDKCFGGSLTVITDDTNYPYPGGGTLPAEDGKFIKFESLISGQKVFDLLRRYIGDMYKGKEEFEKIYNGVKDGIMKYISEHKHTEITNPEKTRFFSFLTSSSYISPRRVIAKAHNNGKK